MVFGLLGISSARNLREQKVVLQAALWVSLGEGADSLGAQGDQEASLIRFMLCSHPHASDMSVIFRLW